MHLTDVDVAAVVGSVVVLLLCVVASVDLDSTDGRRLCINSGLDSADEKNRSQFSIKIEITSLQNLMSMIEATVSSRGRNKLGPKTTPKLDAVIKFLSLLSDTLLR